MPIISADLNKQRAANEAAAKAKIEKRKKEVAARKSDLAKIEKFAREQLGVPTDKPIEMIACSRGKGGKGCEGVVIPAKKKKRRKSSYWGE